MSNDSPASLLIDATGATLPVADGAAVGSKQAVLSAGKDDSNNAQMLRTATDGTVRVDPTGTTAQPVTDGGGSLTVDGTVGISGSVAVTGALTDAQLRATPVPVSDGGGSLTVDGTVAISGTVPVSAAALPLPTGASTAALQTSGNSSLSSIDTKTLAAGQATMAASSPVVIASNQSTIPVSDGGGSLTVDGTVAISGTVPVSAASLPLPTGAATAALQTQPGVDIGDVTVNNAAGAAAVNIQDGGNSITVDGTVAISGTVPISAAALPLPTGASTSALQTTGNASIASIDTKTLAAGQAVMTASSPVVIASNQSPVPITSNPLGDEYRAVTAVFTAAAAPTDIFTIFGSATRTVYVTRIQIDATQTTAASRDVFIIKRSTANTAGTAVATTRVPKDTSSPAATAVVQHYTANPTLGTTVGSVDGRKLMIPAPASLIDVPTRIFEFACPVVLRGVAQCLSINLNSVASAGSLIICTVEFVEAV